MPTGLNKATVRAFFDTMNREHSMKSLPLYAATGYKAHFPGMELDSAAMIGFGASFFAAIPNLTHTYDNVFAEDDMVGLRLVLKGTHTQPLQTPGGAIPASNKEVTFVALNLFRMTSDGKIAEHWSAYDMLGFLQDIGAIPR